MERAAELKQIDQEPNFPNQPSYAFADGSLDVAYEEIAEARANCMRAYLDNKISDEVLESAFSHFKKDYKRIGYIPSDELLQLINRYALQNKSLVYKLGSLEIVC